MDFDSIVKNTKNYFFHKMAKIFYGVMIVFFIWYLIFMNHTSINEVGIAYDSRTGEVDVQITPGFYLTNPLVFVTYVRTTPFPVTINSKARTILSKVVRFKVEGLDQYIRLQGWGYNLDSDLPNIMLGYAFSNAKYEFLEIMQEAGQETLNVPPLHREPAKIKP